MPSPFQLAVRLSIKKESGTNQKKKYIKGVRKTGTMSVKIPRLPHRTPSVRLTHLSHVRPFLFHTRVLDLPCVGTNPPNFLLRSFKFRSQNISSAIAGCEASKMEEFIDAEKLRSHFLQVLRSRRSPEGKTKHRLGF